MPFARIQKLFNAFYWRIYQFTLKSNSPTICSNLVEWIKSNGQHARIVDLMNNEFRSHFSHHERYLATIARPTLHTVSGHIQLPTGEIILDTAWIPENIMGSQQYFLRLKNKSIVKQGRWFSLILYWSDNYFHWFCDVLPRLYQVLDRLPLDVRFIVPDHLEDWKIKSLAAIGINRDRMVSYDGRVPWTLEELYYAPPIAMTGDIDKESMKWVQSRLLSCPNVDIPTQYGPKIFLSRKKSLRRRIVNEGALVQFLITKGFQVLYAEDHALEAQISIFTGAQFVIGPHGAGLTNVLYCKPGTKILEIFNSSIIRRCYWSLSTALDLKYVCYMAKHVHHELEGEGDIYVDIEDFRVRFTNWYEQPVANSTS